MRRKCRVIWRLSEGAITVALPFSVVIIFMMIGLVKSLRTEEEVGSQYVGPEIPVYGALDEAGPRE
jgi:choline-glycine betaine transporter